jgi:DNA-binding response OmpR family regulator
MIVLGNCAYEEGDMRVLVIEDDEDTAEFIAQGLGDEGHMVEIARDATSDCPRHSVEITTSSLSIG